MFTENIMPDKAQDRNVCTLSGFFIGGISYATGFSAFFIDVAMGILTVLFNKQIMKCLGATLLPYTDLL